MGESNSRLKGGNLPYYHYTNPAYSGAGKGNRNPVVELATRCITTMLYPQFSDDSVQLARCVVTISARGAVDVLTIHCQILAGLEGIEPSLFALEANALPLHQRPAFYCTFRAFLKAFLANIFTMYACFRALLNSLRPNAR